MKAFNGRKNRNDNAGPVVWESAGKIFMSSRQQTKAETASWVREHGTQAWIMKIAGQVEKTDDMPGRVHPEAVVRGMDQLQEIQEKLAGQPDRGQQDGWTRVFWKTNSRNCYNFLKQGARWDKIRHEIIQVRWLEKQKKIEVVPVWETKIQKEIVEADR